MIDRFVLKATLDEWRLWYERTRVEIRERRVTSRIPTKNTLALTGVRRCGKSSTAVELSKKFGPEEVLYYNFEDPAFLMDTDIHNLDELISVFTEGSGHPPKLLIMDEIHNVMGWERWIRKQVDLQKYKIIVTGSSAKLLSSELSTSLSGRAMERVVWPLSYLEFLEFSQPSVSRSDMTPDEHLAQVRNYMRWGGFPEIVLTKDVVERKELLRQYLNDVVYRDVMNRHEIRTKRTLDQLLAFYFSNLSALHSYSSIKKAFGISTDTSAEYTSYLSEAFLVFEVSRFHRNLKIQSRDPKKIYVVDTALANLFPIRKDEDVGKMAENMVFIELKRRGNEIYYFKQLGEVDFLLTHHGRPMEAIQVCYSDMRNEATYQREVSSILECVKFTGLKTGTIITSHRDESKTIDGVRISFVPLFRWCASA